MNNIGDVLDPVFLEKIRQEQERKGMGAKDRRGKTMK
jgi:hypothetical protein